MQWGSDVDNHNYFFVIFHGTLNAGEDFWQVIYVFQTVNRYISRQVAKLTVKF